MKKLLLLTLTLTLLLPATAQQSSSLFKQLTENYDDREGFSASQITKDMFDLYLKKRNVEEDSPVFDALKKLDRITVVSQSSPAFRSVGVMPSAKPDQVEAEKQQKKQASFKDELHAMILDHYRKNEYTLLKTEKRMGEDVKVFLKKDNDKIESLALVTNSGVSSNLVELTGEINLKTVSELSKALNLRGLENLYKIDNSKSYPSRFYGLSSGYVPEAPSKEQIEEMVAKQRQLFEEQKVLSEKERQKIEEQARQMYEKQAQMAEKYREMAEQYKRQPIFLSAPGDTNTVYYIDDKKVKAKEIKELDPESIDRVEVNKSKKEGGKASIRIYTK